VLELEAQFKQGRVTLSLDTGTFLKNWLSSHLLGTDKKYGPFLNERGIR
jgi:hemerythrin